jgi:hypothetical protein
VANIERGIISCIGAVFSCVVANAQDLNSLRDEQDLLRHRLVDLGAGEGATDADISAFEANISTSGTGPGWTVIAPSQDGENFCRYLIVRWRRTIHSFTGDQKDNNIWISSTVSKKDERTTTYTLENFAQVPKDQCINVPAYAISASYVIPKCNFDYAKTASCYPDVIIKLPSKYDKYDFPITPDIIGAFGSGEPTFPQYDYPISVTVSQQNHQNQTIGPGYFLHFDRSEGDLTVTSSAIQVDNFRTIRISQTLNIGPQLVKSADSTSTGRLTFYRQLAGITSSRDFNGEASVVSKTLHTQVRMMSAYAVRSGFAKVIRELLVSRARDLASDDQQVLALRNLVLSQTSLGVDDVDLTIKRIDQLLSDPNTANRDTLGIVRQELIRARDAVGDNGSAVKVLRNNLISEVDRQIADYQTLVLEYAQFVDDATLGSTIPPEVRAKILSGINPTDVRITDDTLGGRGPAMRLATGLPEP